MEFVWKTTKVKLSKWESRKGSVTSFCSIPECPSHPPRPAVTPPRKASEESFSNASQVLLFFPQPSQGAHPPPSGSATPNNAALPHNYSPRYTLRVQAAANLSGHLAGGGGSSMLPATPLDAAGALPEPAKGRGAAISLRPPERQRSPPWHGLAASCPTEGQGQLLSAGGSPRDKTTAERTDKQHHRLEGLSSCPARQVGARDDRDGGAFKKEPNKTSSCFPSKRHPVCRLLGKAQGGRVSKEGGGFSSLSV